MLFCITFNAYNIATTDYYRYETGAARNYTCYRVNLLTNTTNPMAKNILFI